MSTGTKVLGSAEFWISASAPRGTTPNLPRSVERDDRPRPGCLHERSGVIFDSELNFVQHFKEKIHTAYSSGIIKTNFINIYDRHITFVYNFSQTITAIYYEDAFVMLYKSLVRSHLEYANSVGLWNTDRLDLIKDLKKSKCEQLN